MIHSCFNNYLIEKLFRIENQHVMQYAVYTSKTILNRIT